MEADAAGADSAAAIQPPTHSTPARKEAQDPGKRREKQRAAAAAARKRREGKGPTPRELSRRREPPELPALPAVGAMPQAGVAAVDVAVVAPRQAPAAPGDVAVADIDTHTAAARRGPDDRPPATIPVISSPAELTTQCAVIQPLLQAAIREVARQRPAEPLRFLADLLVSGADSLHPRDNAPSPGSISSAAASSQSVAGYLSRDVLPGAPHWHLHLLPYHSFPHTTLKSPCAEPRRARGPARAHSLPAARDGRCYSRC